MGCSTEGEITMKIAQDPMIPQKCVPMNIMEDKNAEMIYEFDMYVLEHPKFAENTPQGAIVAMQIEGDEEFNAWSKRLAESQAEKGQPIVYVKIKKIKPLHSRIEEVELERVA